MEPPAFSPLLASGGTTNVMAALLEIVAAVLYIVLALIASKLVEHYEEHSTHEEGFPAKAKQNAPMLALIVVAGLLAYFYRKEYRPFIAFPALVGIGYAVEHLSSLSSTGKKFKQTVRDLDLAQHSITELVNRVGSRDWKPMVNRRLQQGFRMIVVFNVWDDQPNFVALPEGSLQERMDEIVLRQKKLDPSSIWLLTLLLQGMEANAATKCTFLGKIGLEPEHWLTGAGKIADLNLLGCLLQLCQIRTANLESERRSQGVAKMFLKWTLEGKEPPELFEASQLEGLLGIQLNGAKFKWSLIDRSFRSIYEDDGHRGGRRFVGSERAYFRFARVNTTVPWVSLIGSPDAELRQGLPRKHQSDLESLEISSAFALVQGTKEISEEALVAHDLERIQSERGDYAFDLVVDPLNSPFQARADSFENEAEASSTRLAIRGYDRMLRSELDHAVPMDLYLLGRMSERHSRTGEYMESLDGVSQTAILDCFIKQQISLGEKKNGPPPEGCDDEVDRLIWRML